uniref:hypothetical protein n=1 Tax=Enterococcus faecium TaxID=1352 RepID=UPI003F7E2E81
LSPRVPRYVPDWRELFESLNIAGAARLASSGATGGVAIGAIMSAAAESLDAGDLYFATRDVVSTAETLMDDAPSIEAGAMEPRFVLFAEPLRLGTTSARNYAATAGALGESRDVPVDIVGLARIERPDAFSVNEVFAEDFYAMLTLVPEGEAEFHGDVRAGLLFTPNEIHSAARLVFWILENPDLMDRETIDATPQSKAARRRGKHHKPRTVTIVDLRAAHREAAADVAAAERTYRSRWIVRGHWHRFWTGPRDGERKLETRYVMPYVKGPAGAPLNVTERVKKW